MGGLRSAGAWARGWREPYFGIDLVGRVGPQNFGADQQIWQGRNFGMDERYDFINFCYEVLLMISLHMLYCVFPLNSYFIISTRRHYFQKLKVKPIPKILLNYLL